MRHKTHPSRGVLLVELLIGMVIIALIMLAAAAIVSAVAEGWQDQDVTQSFQLQAGATYARVQNQLQGAKYVGYCNSGDDGSGTPGCIFFWQNDNFGGVEASDPRVGEMALIIQDPATHSLYLYEAIPTGQMTGAIQALAAKPMSAAEINDPSAPAQFQALSFVEKIPLGGPGNEPDTGNRMHIDTLHVSTNYVNSSLASKSQLPVVEFSIDFTKNGSSLTLCNSATVKGPTSQPD